MRKIEIGDKVQLDLWQKEERNYKKLEVEVIEEIENVFGWCRNIAFKHFIVVDNEGNLHVAYFTYQKPFLYECTFLGYEYQNVQSED